MAQASQLTLQTLHVLSCYLAYEITSILSNEWVPFSIIR